MLIKQLSFRTLSHALGIIAMLAVIFPSPAAFAQANPNDGLEAQVRAYFADIPAMIDVAYCESGFRQFGPDGQALRGGGGAYIGVMQINEHIHSGNAARLGYDINTLAGNVAYARHLYEGSGINPWRGCAPAQTTSTPAAPSVPAATPAALPAGTPNIVGNYVIGMTHAEILTVQQTLNRLGFQIASTGPGSAGHETNFFGALTRDAVRRFQCAKSIVCSGSEGTTGYGRVGPMTRAALQGL